MSDKEHSGSEFINITLTGQATITTWTTKSQEDIQRLINEKKNWEHNEENNDFRRHLESMKKKNVEIDFANLQPSSTTCCAKFSFYHRLQSQWWRVWAGYAVSIQSIKRYLSNVNIQVTVKNKEFKKTWKVLAAKWNNLVNKLPRC